MPIKKSDSSWVILDTIHYSVSGASTLYLVEEITPKEKYFIKKELEFKQGKVKIPNHFKYFFIHANMDPTGFKRVGRRRLKKL